MKKLILALITLVMCINLDAQYVTSGNGNLFSLQALADSAGTQFSVVNENYQMNGEITIAAGDTLKIETSDTVFLESDAHLVIEGVMFAIAQNPTTITASDSTLGFYGITFDESSGSLLSNVHFSYGGGISLLYSDLQIENCKFYKMTDQNGSGAISMLQSNPVIENCEFLHNFQAAISSGATASSSPKIRNNYLYRNNTENANRPQINLGTSDGVTDILIYGNTIDGFYDEAGGISLATLAGGSVSATVDSNIVKNNRYGINIQGNVDAVITSNKILNNNIEDNPMMGGSGISFYSGATAMVSHNIISGNLWGITVINGAVPNLGQLGTDTVNIGHNYIFGNGNNNVTYNLYNNTDGDIYAQNNYWGTDSETEAAAGIFDIADDSSLGEVFYSPIYLLSSEKQFLSFGFEINNQMVWGEIDHDEKQIFIEVPIDTDLSSRAPVFEVSNYATVFVDGVLQVSGETPQNFNENILYSVMAEDSTEQVYAVTVDQVGSVNEVAGFDVDVFPNPFTDYFTLKTDQNIESLFITDASGRLIYQNKQTSSQVKVEVENWQCGVYFLMIKSDDGRISTTKLLKFSDF